MLAGDPELEEAFGPATEGVERGVRFVLPGGGTAESVITTRIVEITPLAQRGAYAYFRAQGVE